ncbi:hypothetical protein ACRE_006550 [Hapsidospora chrysogenum ATCC 11550]|uniref:Rhodopsin domain-containing protein n=1 Tax=Hapsidospora chrysogenum (strain ATCC 11550 / CBS 779.69 / DSM 880 / IAM 14645 / JCM 23072 / IMI 49137) TaxID=857340 RepID=A0A086TGB7_HAPC1|nr:hypothetical protein ACRE_006550 [Hapsidospora chrysogenum ATCC 11550]
MMPEIRYGLGDAVDYAVLANFLQSLYATIFAYTITHFSVKFSIIFQCKRIFTERRAQRHFLALMVYLAVYGAFCLASTIITCWPVAKYWDDSIPGGCIDRSALHYAFAGINIVNDILLLVSPMPFLHSLQIARRVKFVLMGVFTCGGLLTFIYASACIVAIIRLHSLYVNNSAPIDQQPLSGVDIAIWSGLEINVGIMCACAPALKPFFVKIFPRLISTSSSSSSSARRQQPRKPSRTPDHSTATDTSIPLHDLEIGHPVAPTANQQGARRGAGGRHHHRSGSGIEIKVQKSFVTGTVRVVGDDCEDDENYPAFLGNRSTSQTQIYSPTRGRSPHRRGSIERMSEIHSVI